MSKGSLKFNTQSGRHEGELATYHFQMNIALVQRPGEIKDKNPTHNIVGRAPAGHEFHAGVAWEGTLKNGGNRGKTYFTLKFEDPKKMILNAWPSDVAGEFDIQVEKEQEPQPEQAQAA